MEKIVKNKVFSEFQKTLNLLIHYLGVILISVPIGIFFYFLSRIGIKQEIALISSLFIGFVIILFGRLIIVPYRERYNLQRDVKILGLKLQVANSIHTVKSIYDEAFFNRTAFFKEANQLNYLNKVLWKDLVRFVSELETARDILSSSDIHNEYSKTAIKEIKLEIISLYKKLRYAILLIDDINKLKGGECYVNVEEMKQIINRCLKSRSD